MMVDHSYTFLVDRLKSYIFTAINMNQYHVRIGINGEENIFLIDAPNSDDALKQGIEWASGNYDSIEVFMGHPINGTLETISLDSAPFKAKPIKETAVPSPPKANTTRAFTAPPPPPKSNNQLAPSSVSQPNNLQAIHTYRDWLRDNSGYPATRSILRFIYFITVGGLFLFLIGLLISIIAQKGQVIMAGAFTGFAFFLLQFAAIESAQVLFDIADSTLDKNRRANHRDVGTSKGFDIESAAVAVASVGAMAEIATSGVSIPAENT